MPKRTVPPGRPGLDQVVVPGGKPAGNIATQLSILPDRSQLDIKKASDASTALPDSMPSPDQLPGAQFTLPVADLLIQNAEETSSSHLYLIDGSGYIFRAYFALAPLSNKQGLPTNALLGFTRMVLKLLKQVSPRYVAIAFDTAAPTFRHQMFDEYKANRAECPADLVPQMPYFRAISRALGLATLETPGVEADDIIATLARRYKNVVDRVTVVSGDKDLCQLVDEKTVVYDAMREITYDRAGVREKFGVNPEQIIDYLTLIGDSSDNVPGVRGIGPKTAAQLLGHFHTLDELFDHPERIVEIPGLRGAASVQKKFDDSRDSIELSRKLVTLIDDVQGVDDETLETFRYAGPDREATIELFQELDFTSLLKDAGSLKGSMNRPPSEAALGKNYRLLLVSELPQLARALVESKGFAFDTETNSVDARSASLVGISLAWKPNEAVYIPVRCASNPHAVVALEDIRDHLGPIFADPTIPKFGVNLKYDIAVLRSHGLIVNGLRFDGMIASYVLSPDRRQNSLAALSERYFAETMLDYEEMTKGRSIDEVPLEEVVIYACADADTSYRLVEPMFADLDAGTINTTRSLRSVFDRIEMPLIPVLEEMERNGIRIDRNLLQELSVEFYAELCELESTIHAMAGEQFNLNSPKQLSQILFEKMAIPTVGIKRTQSSVSTDASVLIKLAPKYPIVAHILEYRELFKLRTTYIEALQAIADPESDRVHTSFNQAIAATGRLSSSNPNLQNIPIRNPRGRRIREAFVSERGWSLLSADYSQIELRVLAHLSGDEALRSAFERGEDIHLATARELLGADGVDSADLSSMRRVAKTINFGIVYGMSAFRLAQELQIPRGAAQDYIDRYFRRYPRVQEYFRRLENDIDELGYVETMFGRRRYLSELDTSGRDKGYARRSLLNAPLQGSAAEIMKLAMIQVYDLVRGRQDVRMVLQVHDELVVEVEDSSVDELLTLVVQEMESAAELSVPLRVDSSVAKRWE